MDFVDAYKNILDKIENRITEFVPKMEPRNLYGPFSYIMQGGGKRLRPALCMISAGAAGCEPEKALDCGVALEILHNFTLVHDDIMDQSPIRRGRETIHKKWDEPTAILTGDIMVGYAFRLLPIAKKHPRSSEIFKIFTDELIEVCEGQAFDMEFNSRTDVTIDEYLNMIDKKTARLLEVSAVIGGHCAEAEQKHINSLQKIARNAGMSFQLLDDILDITADQAKLGKKIGQDIIEGKKTFLIITAKNLASDNADIELMDEFYRNNGLPEDKVPAIKAIFDKYGVFDKAFAKSGEYLDEAKKHFGELPGNDYKEMLKWLIYSLADRKF